MNTLILYHHLIHTYQSSTVKPVKHHYKASRRGLTSRGSRQGSRQGGASAKESSVRGRTLGGRRLSTERDYSGFQRYIIQRAGLSHSNHGEILVDVSLPAVALVTGLYGASELGRRYGGGQVCTTVRPQRRIPRCNGRIRVPSLGYLQQE